MNPSEIVPRVTSHVRKDAGDLALKTVKSLAKLVAVPNVTKDDVLDPSQENVVICFAQGDALVQNNQIVWLAKISTMMVSVNKNARPCIGIIRSNINGNEIQMENMLTELPV
jgi:hypothetical protein